jgi:hypothetical protein
MGEPSRRAAMAYRRSRTTNDRHQSHRAATLPFAGEGPEPTMDIVPVRPLDEAQALAWLRRQPGGRTTLSGAELGRRWGWPPYRISRRLQQWTKAGTISRRGRAISCATACATNACGETATSARFEAATNRVQHIDGAPELRGSVAGIVAVRNAARSAALVAVPESKTVARLVALEPCPAALPPHLERVEVSPPRRIWPAIGRASVGLGIVATGAFIAFTSIRANAWFGRSLTPDPTAGEIYSHLSVAAEVLACLLPTAIRFYWQNGERWTALRGWTLMTIALTVVFFAARRLCDHEHQFGDRIPCGA